MRFVSRVMLVARSILRRRQIEDDLAAELRFHLEREADAQAARGLSGAEATMAARRTLGSVESIKEACRDTRGPAARLDALQRDVRHAVRLMRKSPGFTLVAVLSLALGIGANSAVFSLLDATVLHPVAYADADRIVTADLVTRVPGRGERVGSWPYPVFDDASRLFTTFEAVAGYAGTDLNLSGRGDAIRLRGEMVGAGYARALGVAPIAGRDFRPDEDRPPAGTLVVLLSEDLWQRQFGGDPGILDRSITLNGLSFSVIGILPGGFRGETGRAEVWVPLATAPVVTGRSYALTERGSYWVRAVARLRPNVTPTQATADVRLAVSRVDPPPPGPKAVGTTWTGVAAPLADSKVDPTVRRALLVLLAAVALVLLIACLNLGSLLLARAMARQREIAVRLAIGAGRGALVRQFLIESLSIAALGGLAGLLVARGLLDLVRVAQPPATWEGPAFLRGIDFGLAEINGYVIAFAALVTLATVVVFGVGPAWHAARGDVLDGLKASPIAVSARGRDRRGFQARSALVVVQLGLTLVLLIGAGLMLRSLAGLIQTPAGIDPHGTLTFRLDLPASLGPGSVMRARFDEVIARVSALPGVQAASLSTTVPLTRTREATGGKIDGTTEIDVGVHGVGSTFFEVMRIPLRRGRLFDERDREGAPHVVVINESVARRYWPDSDPIGHRLTLGLNGWGDAKDAAEIVGVVGDVKYDRLEDPPRQALYISAAQRLSPSMYVVVRSRVDPLTLVAPIREAIASIDSTLPIYDVRTMTDRVADASSRTRFQGMLLSVFAMLALTIATIGVSGVMAYAVTMRTRELGVRLALGANRVDISRLIVGQAARLAACALMVGLPLAFITTRILRGLLYNVTPGDPITFVSAASVLAVVALAACWRPARRAGRIDPLVALRHE